MSTASIENLKHKMLALNPDVRMQLAHTLALSLEGLSCDQVSELWLAEAMRRDAEMESSEIDGIPGEAVFARIESRHTK